MATSPPAPQWGPPALFLLHPQGTSTPGPQFLLLCAPSALHALESRDPCLAVSPKGPALLAPTDPGSSWGVGISAQKRQTRTTGAEADGRSLPLGPCPTGAGRQGPAGGGGQMEGVRLSLRKDPRRRPKATHPVGMGALHRGHRPPAPDTAHQGEGSREARGRKDRTETKVQTESHPWPRPLAAHSSQSESHTWAAEGPPKPPADLSTGVCAAEHGADGPVSLSCGALGRTSVTGCGSCPQRNLDPAGEEQDPPKVTCVFSVTQDGGDWVCGPSRTSVQKSKATATTGRRRRGAALRLQGRLAHHPGMWRGTALTWGPGTSPGVACPDDSNWSVKVRGEGVWVEKEADVSSFPIFCMFLKFQGEE